MNRTLSGRLLAAVAALWWCLAATAVPAKKEWRTYKQQDGTAIEAMLVGDEHVHYYLTRDGVMLVETPQGLCHAELSTGGLRSTGVIAHEADKRSSAEQAVATDATLASPALKALRRQKTERRKPRKLGGEHDYLGSRKGLIVLVNFSDRKFLGYSDDDNGLAQRTLYDAMVNEEGYTNADYGAIGSVHDYYLDQSYGQFDLTFDVVGPVNLPNGYAYYGRDKDEDNIDLHIAEMVAQACEAVDSLVDFSQYDWDGDGVVEEVFFLYAGTGQATGGGGSTIWPHMWTLEEEHEDYGIGSGPLLFDGVTVNTYACSNEIYYSNVIMGIGVFCHEFSHCLGLPDMYDTGYGGNYGMGDWDVLDTGSYNGPRGIGWVPAGYTSYERHFAGWLDYTELEQDTLVAEMAPLQTSPEAFRVGNDAWPDEYYLLENRQRKGWDSYIPGSGLLIMHVDYDAEIWEKNLVNTTDEEENDHQRMTIFHASGRESASAYFSVNDAYPFSGTDGLKSQRNDQLTDTSKPAASLWHPNTDGSLLMHKPITHISLDRTGTVSFEFANENRPSAIGLLQADATGEALYTLGGQRLPQPQGLSLDRRRGYGLSPGLYVRRTADGSVVKMAVGH